MKKIVDKEPHLHLIVLDKILSVQLAQVDPKEGERLNAKVFVKRVEVFTHEILFIIAKRVETELTCDWQKMLLNKRGVSILNLAHDVANC